MPDLTIHLDERTYGNLAVFAAGLGMPMDELVSQGTIIVVNGYLFVSQHPGELEELSKTFSERFSLFLENPDMRRLMEEAARGFLARLKSRDEGR